MMKATLRKENLYTLKMPHLLPLRHYLVIEMEKRILSLVEGSSHKPIVQQYVLKPFAFRILLLLLAQPSGCPDYLLLAAIMLPVTEWEALLPDLAAIILKVEKDRQNSPFETPIVALPVSLTISATRYKIHLEAAQQQGMRAEEIRSLHGQITKLRQSLVPFQLRIPIYDPNTGYCLAPLHHSKA